MRTRSQRHERDDLCRVCQETVWSLGCSVPPGAIVAAAHPALGVLHLWPASPQTPAVLGVLVCPCGAVATRDRTPLAAALVLCRGRSLSLSPTVPVLWVTAKAGECPASAHPWEILCWASGVLTRDVLWSPA